MTGHHLRPRRGWLNDPNGMTYRDGRWHVFFQHNPDAPRHDRIAWGHASSTDLLTWTEHPVAFAPTPRGPDRFGCWSGVILPEAAPGRPAAFYSGVVDDTFASTVCLRWGSEDLMTWSPDPVVVGCTPERDRVRVMRDPFLFEHGGRRWALLGAGLDDGTPVVLVFDVQEVLAWRYAGIFAEGTDPALAAALPADVWECPQLVQHDDGAATLVLSLHDRGVLGQVVAGTGRVVDDDGIPRFAADGAELLDTGTAFYAPQLAQDPFPQDGVWLMGWVREDDRDPGQADQAGCMTLPRRLVRQGDRPRLVLDPRVAHGVPPTLQVTGARPVLLQHPELGELVLPPGSRVDVAGEVTEVHRPGLPPHTTRHPVPWLLPG